MPGERGEAVTFLDGKKTKFLEFVLEWFRF